MFTLDNAVVTKLESLIKNTMRDQQIPGFSIGIIKDGQLAYGKGFGVADLQSQKPVTTEAIFSVASMSKAFTATAIMQLVEQGKINLDAPVTDYLPYFQLTDDRYKDILIRHMLTHSSGLPALNVETLLGYWSEITPEFDENSSERYVRSLRETTLSFAPGQQFAYSDVAYSILGDVIAKVSEQPFEDYIQEHILTPVGMRKSTFLLREVDQDLLVRPHHLDESRSPIESRIFPYTRYNAPCAHLFSNVEDMMNWTLVNLNRGVLNGFRILTEASYEALWAAHVDTGWVESPDPAKRIYYSCGWTIQAIEGYRIVGHVGATLGYHSYILLAPETSSAVVTMGNRLDTLDEPFYARNIATVTMRLLLDLEQ